MVSQVVCDLGHAPTRSRAVRVQLSGGGGLFLALAFCVMFFTSNKASMSKSAKVSLIFFLPPVFLLRVHVVGVLNDWQ